MYEDFVKFLKSYKAGEVIAEEGKNTDSFFCLLQGKVGVWKGDLEEGEDKCILIGEIEEKGSYFGEMSVLMNEARTATIRATTAVKVLQFPGDMLPPMMIRQPKLAVKLATAVAERLKGTTARQQDLIVEKKELQQDTTEQLRQAKQTFERLFVMLSALQIQHQFAPLKLVLTHMSQNRFLMGSKAKFKMDKEFLDTLPTELKETVRNFIEGGASSEKG